MLKSSQQLFRAKVELHYITCKMHHDGQIKMLERKIIGIIQLRIWWW